MKCGKQDRPFGRSRGRLSMQAYNEEGSGPPGVKSGKGCQGQQEKLLQVHQQQMED